MFSFFTKFVMSDCLTFFFKIAKKYSGIPALMMTWPIEDYGVKSYFLTRECELMIELLWFVG